MNKAIFFILWTPPAVGISILAKSVVKVSGTVYHVLLLFERIERSVHPQCKRVRVLIGMPYGKCQF